MPADDQAVGYVIWGTDRAPYGPVELPTLVGWIKDERVVSDTWLYLEHNNCWEKALHVPELQMFFKSRLVPDGNATAASPASPCALRHIKLFATLSDDQLEHLIQVLEVIEVPEFKQLIKPGDPADAMYVVLDGELRVRALLPGQEPAPSVLRTGDFFGEITLFDHGPRSIEVVATTNCQLLKIAAREFEKFVHEAPELAAPFLFEVGKALACRIRSESKRYRDSVSLPRTVGF